MIKCKCPCHVSFGRPLLSTKFAARFNRIQMIEKLPHSATFETYAYDVAKLKEFSNKEDEKDGMTRSVHLSSGKKKQNMSLQRSGSFRGSFRFAKKKGNKSGSLHSAGSLRGRRTSSFV